MICPCSSAGYRFQKKITLISSLANEKSALEWAYEVLTEGETYWHGRQWLCNIMVWPLHRRVLRSLSNTRYGWYFSLPLQSLRKSHNSSQGNKETQKCNHKYQQFLEKLKSDYGATWFQRIKIFRAGGSKNTALETMDICRSYRFNSVYYFHWIAKYPVRLYVCNSKEGFQIFYF